MVLTLLELIKHGSPNDTSNRKRLIRDTLVELIATTVFVFNGTLSAVSTGRKLAGQGSSQDVARIMPIAFAFGISIMTLAYAIGHISGGHMNPAVSLLMFFRRQMSATKMICYWLAQFTGAILGASIMWGCVSGLSGDPKMDGIFHRPPFELGSTTVDASLSTGNAFLIEFMGSFFFFFVIAQSALDKRGIADSFFPALPIGFSLIVVHICLIRKFVASLLCNTMRYT
jgi:glycerol uptake facilitator-like aquaporin